MAKRDKFAFEARKVWMQSLLEDRWKVQRIMEEQGRIMAKMEAATNALRRDRAKAQLVMEAQAEQLKKWAAKSAQLQTQRDALKKELRELKGPAIRRSTAERISREAARMRRRIQRLWRSAPESPALAPPLASPLPPEGRYSAWIAKHEPDKIALEEQRQKASQFSRRPKISLLIPVHNTPRNFLDEIGRGTSTFDGLSIAWSVAEFLHDQIKARTLFATHYHELTKLAQERKSVCNLNVAVREWNEQIIFLRKIVPGGADKSYGIQVARLAG